MKYITLKAYMANCAAYGWVPSWKGLFAFKKLQERKIAS